MFTVASLPPVAVISQSQAPVSGHARQANFTFVGQSSNSLSSTFQCQITVTNLASGGDSAAVFSSSVGRIALGAWRTCISPEVRFCIGKRDTNVGNRGANAAQGVCGNFDVVRYSIFLPVDL